MARYHRKQKQSRKQSRRQSRRQSRKQKQQRGGGSCAALPMNRALFAQAGGNLAPFVAAGGADYLLDASTRVQAEVGPLDAAFAELPSVIPRQAGGRRHRKSHRRSHKHGRKTHKHGRKGRKSQRGGMSAFNGPSMLLDAAQYAKDGTNPQFRTEGEVNPSYGFFKGPQ
jgi:hypothetical protein